MSGRILIVDDAPTNRMILRALLERDYYLVREAEDGAQALEMAQADPPDLILLDYRMPIMDGIACCEALKADPQTANIPVVMITSAHSTKERHRGLQAGADDYLNRPINERILFARIRNLLRVKHLIDELHLRAKATQELGLTPQLEFADPKKLRARVLLVGKDEDRLIEWKNAFEEKSALTVDIEGNEAAALQIGAGDNYDALVICENLDADGIGLRLIANIRASWGNRSAAIVFVANSGADAGLRALDFGASDYVLEPLDHIELAMRLKTQLMRKTYTEGLRNLLDEQLRLSVIDPLTDLHNRRYLDLYLPKMIERAKNERHSFAVMLLDLDRFKSLNDSYGHDFGDYVLAEFSRRVKENLRAADLVVRFGGEEFLIIAPNIALETAEQIAERVRFVVEETPFVATDGEEITVTTSIGVCMIDDETASGEIDFQSIIKAADDALYLAKSKGRNRVIFAAA